MSMSNTEKTVKEIRRKTRRKFSTEEKIRIVLEGLRGECSIAELCRREGINQNLYYRWSKDFLEAGKKRLSGDTAREANTDEVAGLKRENQDLKQAVAELYLRNDWLKKSLTGQGVINFGEALHFITAHSERSVGAVVHRVLSQKYSDPVRHGIVYFANPDLDGMLWQFDAKGEVKGSSSVQDLFTLLETNLTEDR